MGTMSEVQENIRTLNDALPNSLSDEEMALVDQVKQIYNNRIKVKCTDCRYCLPCPQGVNIPRIFSIYNHASVYNMFEDGRRQYSRLIQDGTDAGSALNVRTANHFARRT